MGDSVQTRINFHGLVLCGGKGPNGEVWYYTEEWRRPTIDDPLGFTATKNWQTILGVFLQGLSKDTGVMVNDIVQLPTWQCPSDFIPRVIERLSDVLEFDEHGDILTSVEGAQQAADKYLNSLWHLVPDNNGAPKQTPIPWTDVRRSRDNLEKYVDPARLPSEGFIFDRPKDLPTKELWKFINHIIRDEKGELSPDKEFRWARQMDGTFEVAAKPRRRVRQNQKKVAKVPKAKLIKGQDATGETFDLDGVLSSAASDAKATGKDSHSISQKKRAKSDKSNRSRSPSIERPKPTRSRNKQPKSRARGQKSRIANADTSDTDSDGDIIDKQQILFRGAATQLFIGEGAQWKEDFDARDVAIE
ncbi:hypothetical protein M422DRAFT_28729 [Sphaerobolus stellatus SS14]|nr:hypothetical protein M422DRAFT_28729 [Sphaerobolus stellatus SS14]